jgi:hypothetical protein
MADPFELRRIVDGLCRRDFRSFAIRAFPVLEGGPLELSPHIDIICRLLEKVYDSEVRRAVVCIPPRYLKTYLISIAYTAWLLARNPDTYCLRVLCGLPCREVQRRHAEADAVSFLSATVSWNHSRS